MTASKPRKHRVFLHQRPGHDDLVRRHGSTLGRRTDSHQESETAAALAFASGTAVAGCTKVPPRGVERTPAIPNKTRTSTQGAAESGAVDAEAAKLLALLCSLSPAQRQALVALLRGQ